jgi:tRNA pseudouridine55 synthase
MARRVKPGTRPVSGILLVDKPSGETSNRTLQHVKRLYAAQKAGHTGTLDPIATGMLPICLGSATRVSGLMLNGRKHYRVVARFGAATDTGDAGGTIIEESVSAEPSRADIEAALQAPRGQIRQIPPMYSAIRHQGQRLYALARQGQEVERKPRPVEVFEFVLEASEWPDLGFRVHCSKGTYVRSLVTDLAAAMDRVAHVASLRRLAVAPYREEQMVSMARVEQAAAEGQAALDSLLLGADSALPDYACVIVCTPDASALRQGRRVATPATHSAGVVRVYTSAGEFVGLCEQNESGELKPSRIFPA